MTKALSILFFSFAFSPMAAMSQTPEPVIAKAIRDPKAPSNGAKADVYIQDKKIIAATAPEKKKKKCKRNPTR